MMIRKFMALFLLSLASMIMLAFAIFPHHHHEEYICFAETHCQHEPNAEEHSHDDNSSSSHRCVKSLFQTQVSRTQSLEHSCAEGHCHHFTITLFLTADILQLLSYEATNKNLPTPFYREKLHSAFYISDLSGRAPPFRG